MLSDQLVQELREILREEYQVDMSDSDAAKAAHWLVAYFDALAEAGDRR